MTWPFQCVQHCLYNLKLFCNLRLLMYSNITPLTYLMLKTFSEPETCDANSTFSWFCDEKNIILRHVLFCKFGQLGSFRKSKFKHQCNRYTQIVSLSKDINGHATWSVKDFKKDIFKTVISKSTNRCQNKAKQAITLNTKLLINQTALSRILARQHVCAHEHTHTHTHTHIYTYTHEQNTSQTWILFA